MVGGGEVIRHPSGGDKQSPRVFDARQVRRAGRAEIGDDRVGILLKGEEGLPAAEVLRPMEVAVRDGRQTRAGDPAEERRPVEELEPMGELLQLRVDREPACPARLGVARLVVERVRRDDRGAGCTGRFDCPAMSSSTETNDVRPTATAWAASSGRSAL